MNPLTVTSLTKHYGSVVGVEDVTFTIESGRVFGYLGPNGSGKTTTLRCIMGLLRPTRGSVSILGRPVVFGNATQHHHVGYLPGDLRLWPGLTAEQTLRLLARLDGNPNTARRRAELADRLQLDLHRRVGSLSKGNRQKVGLISAFQNDPKLLVLDEPTTGLDPLVRQTVLDLIRQAARNGAAVLLSSHELTEVAMVCHHAAILRRGRLVESAPVSEIERRGARFIRVWFTPNAPCPLDAIRHLPGVDIIEHDGPMLDIQHVGPLPELLAGLAQFPVERIAARQTPLEQAFLQYYGPTHTTEPHQ